MPDGDEVPVRIYQHYCPPGVKRVIGSGTSAFIGEVDESTVLKFPKTPGGDTERLKTEQKLLEIIGLHPRIIGYKGFSEIGLYLEFATNGTMAEYLAEPDTPPTPSQRLSWCRETAEAVAHIHSKRVLHCDLQPTNLLLDNDLHVKLADFQGQHLSKDGEVLIDGWGGEPTKLFLPREDCFVSNFKTDLFALGCTLYFIMLGHACFPDISEKEVGWRAKVEERFQKQQFPQDLHACAAVTLKCWMQEYDSAEDVVRDIIELECPDPGSVLVSNLPN